MNTFITSYVDWLEEYKKDKYKTWIRAILSNNSEIYLKDYSEWLKLKEYCKSHSLAIRKIGLQYRSHSIEIDTQPSDGVYVVRSILGSFGADTKQTITIGTLHGSTIKKTIWITPELIKHIDEEDKIESCFEEAIIYNYDEKK